jgi:hypothetical protein
MIKINYFYFLSVCTTLKYDQDASYQVSVHLAQPFQRRLLEIDQPETRIAYGGHVC